MADGKKQTLCFFIPSMSHGGAERVTVNLVNEVVKRREFIVHLVLVKARGPYFEQISPDVVIIDLKSTHTRNVVFSLSRYIAKHRPAVIVSAMHHANVIALLANKICLTHTARIITALHINMSVSLKHPTNLRARIILPCVKFTYRWADHVVAVSKGVADDFTSIVNLAPEKISVIYNPVLTKNMKSLAKETVDHPWFQDSETPVILAAGRLHNQKNFGYLVNAFNTIKEKTSTRLLILGEGEERESLETIIDDNKLGSRVSLLGFVSNPYAYMAKADVYVMSSLYEGLPTVLIEAMYCNARIVSTDCPSGPREILADGKYGVLAPLDDVNAFGRAILKAINTPNVKTERIAIEPYLVKTAADRYLSVMFADRNNAEAANIT